MDRLTPAQRSRNMARIKGRNTAPELEVRRLLHRLGYRFRLHCEYLPGRPDVVLPRFQTAFLIHGCFWHRHAGCRFAYMPKSNVEFWDIKFDRNVARDREVQGALEAAEWKVHVIWECETRDSNWLECRLKTALEAEVLP